MTRAAFKNGVRVSSLLFVVVAIAIATLLIRELRITHRTRNDSVGQMYRNALHIGNAIRHYQGDNGGKIPATLSELVPSYVGLSDVDWFFRQSPTSLSRKDLFNPVDIPFRIDNDGAFTYVGRKGATVDLLLYERRNTWPRDRHVTEVVTLTTNFLPRLRSVNDLEEKLKMIQ
jgi:hypothetical protein